MVEKRQESIGQLYKSISVETRDFSIDSEKLVKVKTDPYVNFCKSIYSKFPGLGANAKYDEKLQSAVDFLNWNLTPDEYSAGVKFVTIIGLVSAIILATIFFIFAVPPLSKLFGSIYLPVIFSIGIPLITFVYAFVTFKNKPFAMVNSEKIRALTFVPEIIGYLVMSMKLVPNLEKAIEFASNHGHGKVAEDLKKLLWEVKVGIKNSVSEALDELAYKWGDVSIEFKKALMKIRASVIETSESKRYQLLDQTMSETLASIKNKLEDYARELSQPATTMFYLGILLPLLLIIVLPVGSAFSGSALAKPVYLILLYNIALPIACIAFARNIIGGRPATYVPPEIPDNHPDLPPKHTISFGKANISVVILIIILLIAGIFASYYVQKSFGKTRENILIEEGYNPENPEFGCSPQELQKKIDNPKYQCESEIDFWSESDHDITPYFIVYGFLITMTFCISLWLYSDSIYKRKIQLKTRKMEDEFKDALYVIASRLGENKPIEDALSHTRSFLPKSTIATNIFGKTIDNIRILGLNLQSALFDPSYGALKNNPSTIINGAMRLMVDSVQLGVTVAAKTLMSYSIQLRNSDEVNKMLSNLVSSVTSTLSSMSKYIAPVVLGITTALQKIVVSTLKSISSSGTLEQVSSAMTSISTSGLGGGVNTASMSSLGSINTDVINSLASSTTFLIIVAIYVIQIVIIMTYFTTMIEEDNPTLAKLNIAKTLPVAVILFIATTIAANMIF